MTIWEQLHPMTVHFPIAFLLVGWLAEPLAVWLKVPRLGPFGFWCGVVGAFIPTVSNTGTLRRRA